MQVILNEDMPALGKAGDVVKVADGFGRNFLFPLKKALPATESNLKKLEQDRKIIEAKREKAKKEAEELGQKIRALSITVEKQAGEEDKIFGSVSTREIADELSKQGFSLDKRLILLKEQVRKLGEYTAEVHLHGDVIVPLKVVVTKKS